MGSAKQISVFGATGSIGQSTLTLVRQHPEQFSVKALVAGKNYLVLAALAREFHPKVIGIYDASKFNDLCNLVNDLDCDVVAGEQAINDIATMPVDLVIAGISGFAGLSSHILPIDSEHNAVFQCWSGWKGHQTNGSKNDKMAELSHICLTASGGPFLTLPLAEFPSITPEAAVKHPNWSMGQKISVDSATMMNKGLEVIEAHWLFGLDSRHIEVLVHPQQAIHGMVYFH